MMKKIALFMLLGCAASGAAPLVTVSVTRTGDGFTVDAVTSIPVCRKTAWNVLTDFDNMAAILGNLTSSRIVRRDGNTLWVAQEGKAKYGFMNYSFSSEREIQLKPAKRILSRQVSGSFRRFESETRLRAIEGATELRYHAEMVPDSALARLFGSSFIQHEIEEQFVAMGSEMERRSKP